MAIDDVRFREIVRRTGLLALVAALWCSTAAAQAPPGPLDELRRLVDEQRALIDAQAARLDAQGRDLADLRKRIDDVSTVATGNSQAIAVEQTTPRAPELPTAVVSAGDFPGSIRMPGTDTAIKVGGQARMTLVNTLGPLGVDDRFITSSIPVEGSQTAGEDSRTTYTPVASRVNLEVRSPSHLGDLRTFLEWDFAGTNKVARLRHAFIQVRHWTIGQTWSTFSDPEAEPMGIDFEGLNAISLFRQPQIRFTQPLRPGLSLSVAAENPAPDLTGASGVNVTPDFIARLRWDRANLGPAVGPLGINRPAHVQVAILMRALRGELTNRPDTTLSTGGFGGNVSGVLVPRWSPDDRFKFAVNTGWGIGRYITDLGTLGGQDAFYDPLTASLRALPVYASYFGYERAWKPTFTSAVTYGLVRVNNLDVQPSDSLRETQRGTLNLTWTPISQLDIVIEFLTGRRVNKDGARGDSRQIQAGWTFRF